MRTSGRLGLSALSRAVAPVVIVVLLGFPGSLHAQGLGGLSQLLGGFQQNHRSDRSETGVSVERGAAPYLGEFVGTRSTNSEPRTFNSWFPCYPAVDPALAQTQTFVCYAARIPPN